MVILFFMVGTHVSIQFRTFVRLPEYVYILPRPRRERDRESVTESETESRYGTLIVILILKMPNE